eukprot:m51a1_g7161 hypothetical protein (390) ;mRNA; f:31589-36740
MAVVPSLVSCAVMERSAVEDVPVQSAACMAERTLQALVDATPEFGKDVEMRLVETMEDPHVAGWSITTHQQTIDGIPIVGAVVWNSEGQVVSVTGTTVADAHERTLLRARTAVSQEEAVGVAQRAAEAKDSQARCAEARRVVLRPGMANGEPGPNLPTWEVVCGTADVYVSTQSPRVLALNPRMSHLVANVSDYTTEIKSIVEGIALEEDIWRNVSGRNGYDNQGSKVIVLMHADMDNAAWSQSPPGYMVFGSTMVSRSIMWHEFGHGITNFLDKLWYEAQSGALNEAWSDIISVCFDLEGVRVVVSDPVFGNVEGQTNSSGCATLELEQGVEYNITATKDDYMMNEWRHTLTSSTEVLRFAMVRSAGVRATAALGLALLCAAARLWVL